MPLACEGKRIEPPVSVPSAPKQSPLATATPDPEDDPPGQKALPQGLIGGEIAGWYSAKAPSVSCNLPRRTTPALRRRATTVESRSTTFSANIGMPPPVGMPSMSQRSFTATGTPCKGPRLLPLLVSASAWFAAANAFSRLTADITFENRIQLIDPLQHCCRNIDRSQLSAGNHLTEFDCTQISNIIVHKLRHPKPRQRCKIM